MSGNNSIGNKANKRSGRPKFLTNKLQRLQDFVLAHPSATLREIAAHMSIGSKKMVSEFVVKSRLKELGVVRHVPKAALTGAEVKLSVKLHEEKGKLRYGYKEHHRSQEISQEYASSLTDAEWELVSPLFAPEGQPGRPPAYERRAMLDAMLYVLRGGIPWRMLPKSFPPWHAVFKTFQRWATQGKFERMYDNLREMYRLRVGKAAEPSAAVIDSQSVKTSAQGGPKGYDAGKKIKGRKRHLLTDTLGLLLVVLLHPADIQDRDAAHQVVAHGRAKCAGIKKLFADSGYAGKQAELIQQQHKDLEIEILRSPANHNVGRRILPGQSAFSFASTGKFVILPKRWVIERTNAWSDRIRRLAKDQDRSLESATAWIWLGQARMLMKRPAA